MRLHSGLAVVVAGILFSLPAGAGDLSRVFVYSQRDTPARSWIPIVCDGHAIAEVRRGFYFAANVSSGRHSLSLANGVPVSVEVRSGEDAFVRVDWNYDVRRTPIPVLSSVTGERAKQEMRFLTYIGANRIRSAAVSGADPRPPEKPRFKARKPE